MTGYEITKTIVNSERSPQVPADFEQDYWFRYTYKRNGALESVTYPTGRKVSYTYDLAGRPTGAGVYAAGIQYAPHGAVEQMTTGQTLAQRCYNDRLQTSVIRVGATATPNCADSGSDDRYVPMSPLTPRAESWFDAGTNRLTDGVYDAAGNQTQVDPFTIDYDVENRPKTVTQTIHGTPYTTQYAASKFGLTVVARMLQSEQLAKQSSADSFLAPREELEATVRALRCR